MIVIGPSRPLKSIKHDAGSTSIAPLVVWRPFEVEVEVDELIRSIA